MKFTSNFYTSLLFLFDNTGENPTKFQETNGFHLWKSSFFWTIKWEGDLSSFLFLKCWGFSWPCTDPSLGYDSYWWMVRSGTGGWTWTLCRKKHNKRLPIITHLPLGSLVYFCLCVCACVFTSNIKMLGRICCLIYLSPGIKLTYMAPLFMNR